MPKQSKYNYIFAPLFIYEEDARKTFGIVEESSNTDLKEQNNENSNKKNQRKID